MIWRLFENGKGPKSEATNEISTVYISFSRQARHCLSLCSKITLVDNILHRTTGQVIIDRYSK